MSRRLKGIALAVLVIVLLPLAAVHLLFRGSLPKLDGDLHAPGLRDRVSIERDSLGIPTITAANRPDLAYGTGFAHAQDRFFQMDLSRRLAAGELQEIFGQRTLEQDARAGVFHFRAVAKQVLAQASPEQKRIVAAYTRGVNAGVQSLMSRPWEYWLFGAQPVAWREEDSILMVYAMWWDLQYPDLNRELVRRKLAARLGDEMVRFLYPARATYDPLPVPAAGELRLTASTALPLRGATPGSNNWALAGNLTTTGAALVASDMHLRLRVPAIWYRARLRIQSSDPAKALELNGLTLPGAPVLVAGSNGHVVWAFTNSAGDWSDVHSGSCEDMTQGALIHMTADECWYANWLATVPEATNLNLLSLERVTSVDQLLKLASTVGIPHQNVIAGDREGHIGWTILGRIPIDTSDRRAAGTSGWTNADTHPHLLDPPQGRLWTANARATDDPAGEAAIGGESAGFGANYDFGARAGQIGESLLALKGKATPARMLNIQLDDRALFLTRWQQLLVNLLDAEALKSRPSRAEFKRLVETWKPRASADSVGYRLVAEFHLKTMSTVWSSFTTAGGITTQEPVPGLFEAPLWTLVTQQPAHLLPAPYPTWRDFLLAQVDATLNELALKCSTLATCTWGARQPVAVRHPLSPALSVFAPIFDMPTYELPGDHDMPRVQDGTFGASERFAVSPGHEADGYLHLPGGQSAHPLSPYYRAGFNAWAEGKPLPFLPGETRHTLRLDPF